MGKQTFEIDGLKCICCENPNSIDVTYILYPMDILSSWIEPAVKKFRVSIVVITGMDWDDDLTPWQAPGVPKGCPDFKGLASRFLSRLERVVNEIEARMGLSQKGAERTLVGVSLSGLFTLWQWPQCGCFKNIASLSGSFWYERFMEWFLKQNFTDKSGVAYFLLGDKESHSSVKVFDSVGTNTEKIVSTLKSVGINAIYELVPGGHYSQPIERLNRAMTALNESILKQ